MNLTQVPISMIDTVAGDAGKVLTSNGSTLSWTASASITPSSTTTAKAWVNFNGTGSVGAQTIRSSYNVSSVTKNAAGDYTVNFATPMADANYAMSLGGHGDTTSVMGYVTGFRSATGGYTPTTTSIRLQSCNGANVTTDIPCVCVSIFGN